QSGVGVIDRCMAEIFSSLGMSARVTSWSNGKMSQSKVAGVSPDIVAPRGQMGQRLGRTFRFSLAGCGGSPDHVVRQTPKSSSTQLAEGSDSVNIKDEMTF